MASNKERTQDYIRKLLSDGKVSKSEVRDAANRGIKLDRISAAAQKYTMPGNPFSRKQSVPFLNKTPASITITPGAQKLIGRGVAGTTSSAATQAAPPPPPGGGFQPSTLPVNNFPQLQPPDTSAADALAAQVAQMQQQFMQSMQQQQQMFQEMQTSQAERMEALQQQMAQQQIAMMDRPQVAGVKMATGAAGTPMQIAKRGVTGAFGRRGMRISSINV